MKQTIKIIFIGLILSTGLTFAFTAPTASYPTNSLEPMDISSTGQIKTGGLSVNGALSVFNGVSKFFGDVSVGSATTPKNLFIVGDTGVGIQPSSKLEVLGSVKVSTLSHATSGRARVCANNSGVLSLCPTGALHLLYGTVLSGQTCGSTPNGCTWTVPDGVYKIHTVVKGGGGGNGVVKDIFVNPGDLVKVIVGKNNCNNPCSPSVMGGASDLYINGASYSHGNPSGAWVTGYVDITW